MKNKNDYADKNFLGAFKIFLLFIFGGIFFRYGIKLLDELSQYVTTLFAQRTNEIGLSMEDVARENHKRWSYVYSEFPIESEESLSDPIGFMVGDEDWDDDEE